MLLDAGADLNYQTSDGTALCAAAMANQADVVSAICRRSGVDLNKESPDGMTALVAASYAHSLTVVSVLLEGKADINYECSFEVHQTESAPSLLSHCCSREAPRP